jgi:hypothetical protein
LSRTKAEIWFRFRQESANIGLWLAPPSWPRGAECGGLPLPARDEVRTLVRGTAYEERLHLDALRIAGGELPAFGQWLRPEGAIAWRKDYRHGQETDARYFRRIPYLDFERAGDHKWIWEINRHQHLVLLAQAWTLDPAAAYATALAGQLESWLDANPPQVGVNWTSALEVAFRALSWIWILHWAGETLPEHLRERLLGSLRAHGRHLYANISIYFSPNTHLLGEALALHALGKYMAALPEAASWRERGGYWMQECLRRQVREDGSYFEQSSYYHIYGLDMFSLHAVWNGGAMGVELERMAEFAAALLGADGRIPLLGDDDGGRLFHPFGPRDEFGRGSLAVFAGMAGWAPGPSEWLDREAACEMAVWWLGARAAGCWEVRRRGSGRSRLFAGTGLAVLRGEGLEVTVDVGPFGPGSAGHSHADTLSLTVRRHGREVLIDPGTFTYLSDPAWRERFRGARAHNTVTVEGVEQAAPGGPFRWLSKPSVQVLEWQSDDVADTVAAVCAYGAVRHYRVVRLEKGEPRIWIADRVEGAGAGVSQYWHLGETAEELGPGCFRTAGARITLEKPDEMSIEESWRSRVLGSREPAQVVRVDWDGASGRTAVIDWNPNEDWNPKERPLRITAEWGERTVAIQATGSPPGHAILKWKPEG